MRVLPTAFMHFFTINYPSLGMCKVIQPLLEQTDNDAFIYKILHLWYTWHQLQPTAYKVTTVYIYLEFLDAFGQIVWL